MAKKKVTEKLSDEEEAKRYHREKAREFRLRIKSLSKEERKNRVIKKRGPRKKEKGKQVPLYQQQQQTGLATPSLETTLKPSFSIIIPTLFEQYPSEFPVSSFLQNRTQSKKSFLLTLPIYSLRKFHLFTQTAPSYPPSTLLSFFQKEDPQKESIERRLVIFSSFLKENCHGKLSKSKRSKNFDLEGSTIVGYTVNAFGATGFCIFLIGQPTQP